MRVFYIDEKMMEQTCHHLAIKFFDKNEEPIAPFRSRNKALLNSALNLPKATFDATDLYPQLTDKAAVLFYTLIKNHAFENGNKRIATATLFVFLGLNDYWLTCGTEKLSQLAIKVAGSAPEEREKKLQSIKLFLEANLEKFRDLK